MAKHRRQNKTTRRIAIASTAVAMGATAISPAVAGAAEVQIPETGYTVDVPGLENVPGVQDVPGYSDYVVQNNTAGGSSAPAAPASEGQRIVEIAQSKIGAPYVYGASGPNAFDCSGFTSWVYAQVGKQIPRTSQAQASAGTPVAYNDLQPGDIVSFYGGASHVGIYIGDGKIIDALNSGTPVGVRTLDYMPFNNAVRF
ncbi:endopeptidase [Corynebacterium frankenforstense DSM 45800]|uniref:Endopeptidase n=1 Tax=Corynebacterium frankenforstense DSM 45800 TaxID=1437875 RepID=A0A1L7CTT9_9CORY|nr:C40 family peptidase [Corynebacterium frankenforstense]APT89239.1 endopeptidase [Corynebacterium frankenforstense DSM 45800]